MTASSGVCARAGFVPDVVQEAHGMHGALSLVAVESGVPIVPASMATVRPAETRYLPLAEDGAQAKPRSQLVHEAQGALI